MSDAPTTEFWHVQLPSGEVRYLSLEELDESFQRDEVDAKTYVLKEGTTTWMRLGELLGLDEAPPELVAVPVAPYSIGGMAAQAQPQVTTGEFYPPSTIRPVVADVADVGDLDDDLLVASMRPKKKNVAVIAGGAFVAVALLVVGITRASSGDTTAAAAQPPPPVSSLPAAAPDPVVAAPSVTLSDDVKQKLLEADKAREAKAAARAAENAKYHTSLGSYRTPKSGQVFHKGGNKYDPLNSGN